MAGPLTPARAPMSSRLVARKPCSRKSWRAAARMAARRWAPFLVFAGESTTGDILAADRDLPQAGPSRCCGSGGTLGDIRESVADEGLHPAGDDPDWQESVYLAWRDPVAGLGGNH